MPREINAEEWEKLTNLEKIKLDKERAYEYFREKNYSYYEIGLRRLDHSEIIKDICNYFKNDEKYLKRINEGYYEEEWEKSTNLEKIALDKEKAYKYFRDNNFTFAQIGLNKQEHSELISDIRHYFKDDEKYLKRFNEIDPVFWENLSNFQKIKLDKERAYNYFREKNYTYDQIGLRGLEHSEIIKDIRNYFKDDEKYLKRFNEGNLNEVWEDLTGLQKIEEDKERAYKFFRDNNYTSDQVGLNNQEHSEIIKEIFDYFENDRKYQRRFNEKLYIDKWEKLPSYEEKLKFDEEYTRSRMKAAENAEKERQHDEEWEKLPTYKAKLEFDKEYTEFQLKTAKLEKDVKAIYNILGKEKAFDYFKEKGYGEKELASFNSYRGVGQDEFKTIEAVPRKELLSYIQLYSTEEKQKLFPKLYNEYWNPEFGTEQEKYEKKKLIDPERAKREVFDPAPYSLKREYDEPEAVEWLRKQPEETRTFLYPDGAVDIKMAEFKEKNPSYKSKDYDKALSDALNEIERANYQSLVEMKDGMDILEDKFNSIRSHTISLFNSKEYDEMKQAYQKFAEAYNDLTTGNDIYGIPRNNPDRLSKKDIESLQRLKDEMSEKAQRYIEAKEKQKGGKGISAHWTGQGADRLGFANALVSFRLEPGISRVSMNESFETKASKGKVKKTTLSQLTERSKRGRKGLDIEIKKMKRADAKKKQRQRSQDKPKKSKEL